jgi:hypothetical protein
MRQEPINGTILAHRRILDAHAMAQLRMPEHIHLHEAGLHQSPCLKELADNRQANVKAHVTWASKVTKVVTLLPIFSFVSNVSNLPFYNISPMATLAEKMVCCFHEANKL